MSSCFVMSPYVKSWIADFSPQSEQKGLPILWYIFIIHDDRRFRN